MVKLIYFVFNELKVNIKWTPLILKTYNPWFKYDTHALQQDLGGKKKLYVTHSSPGTWKKKFGYSKAWNCIQVWLGKFVLWDIWADKTDL